MQTRSRETIVAATVFDEAIRDPDVMDRQADTEFSERLGHRRTCAARSGIFFDGQIFDAYVFSSELISKSKKSILLIDNYIDETTLLQLSKRL